MKNAVTIVARPVMVKVNTTVNNPNWAQIKEIRTGKVLHTGRPAYIKRLARRRYNTLMVS